MTFLQTPYPDRCVQTSYLNPDDERLLTLSIGLQIITESSTGLALPPHKAVVVAIGPKSNPEERVFDISPVIARDLSKRLVEFADAAEDK